MIFKDGEDWHELQRTQFYKMRKLWRNSFNLIAIHAW